MGGAAPRGARLSPGRRRRRIAHVVDASAMHRRCIGDASRDPPTPSARSPSGKPLAHPCERRT
eukprot:5514975-Pyramimonas_sp.AAC.1